MFNMPFPGGHAGRSRARVELVRCSNPYQIIPCGPHARADVGILPILWFSQCSLSRGGRGPPISRGRPGPSEPAMRGGACPSEPCLLGRTLPRGFRLAARSLPFGVHIAGRSLPHGVHLMGRTLPLRVQFVGRTVPHGVHLLGRSLPLRVNLASSESTTWDGHGPIGVTKRSACAATPALGLTTAVIPAPCHGRRGAEGVNIFLSRALPSSSGSTLVSAFLPRAHAGSCVVGGRAGVGGAL